MFTFTLSCFCCAFTYFSKVFSRREFLFLLIFFPRMQTPVSYLQLLVLCAHTLVQLCSITCGYLRKSV